MAELRVACAQTVPVAGDVNANVEQHLALLRTAAHESAEVGELLGQLPTRGTGVLVCG